jgi:hypothetical protein
VLSSVRSKPIYPHRPAKLVVPNASSKNQSWLIKFYVWHVGKQKLEMQRDYECNYIKDLEDRKKWCKQRIKDINVLLSTGLYAGDSTDSLPLKSINEQPQLDEVVTPTQSMQLQHGEHPTIIAAIDFTLKQRRNIKHFRDYEQKLKKFKEWIIKNGLNQHVISHFSHRYIVQFKDSLEEEGLQIRTINNYMTTISLIFNTYNEFGDSEDIIKNPMVKVQKDKNPEGKNIAYTDEQQKTILNFIAKSAVPQVELIVRTMFYTLARTDELSQLQVWMIGAKRSDQIYFPANICKNGHEKNVTIPDELEELFTKYKIRELPKDWYVIAKGFLPGETLYSGKNLANRYRERILDKLDYTIDYTLYSWKHTGVCKYWLNGVSEGSLMLQAGWRDPHSFRKYLKSLGLFDNPDIKSKSPKLPA